MAQKFGGPRNLAAAVALKAGRNDGPQLCQQVLIYPVLDPNCDSDSYVKFAEGFGLTRATMQWFWQQYLGSQQAGSDSLAALMTASDLSVLPPTHLITAEYDVLRDEGEQFVQQLLAAGVDVTHRRYAGMLHGFVHFSGIFDDGAQAVSDIAAVFRKGTSTKT